MKISLDIIKSYHLFGLSVDGMRFNGMTDSTTSTEEAFSMMCCTVFLIQLFACRHLFLSYVSKDQFLNQKAVSKFCHLTNHTTQTVRNRCEKLEHKGKAIFDIPFIIRSHAKSMKKILGALQCLPVIQHSQFGYTL